MMAEMEMGLTCLEAKDHQALLATADANREAGDRLSLTALGRNQLFRTLVLNFWSLEPRDSTSLLAKPPGLWCFPPAARGSYRVSFA